MENHNGTHKNNKESNNTSNKNNKEINNEANKKDHNVGEGKVEESKEEEEKAEGRSGDKKTSEGPTEAEIKQWIKANKVECDIKGCKDGLEGRPYRSKRQGSLALHK